MNKNFLFPAAGAATVLLAGSLFFLRDTPAPVAPAGAPIATVTKATPASSSETLLPWTPGTTKDGKKTMAFGAVNPDEYSSVPPMPQEKKDILKMVERRDLSDLDKAKAILAMMSSLSAEAQIFAMERAAALIPDDNYVQLRPTLYGLSKNPELREVVLTDVLTRSEKVRMPSMVEMLRQPPSEIQQEAREVLLAYLDEDPGTDLAKWDAAVKKFLIENEELE